MVKVGKCGLIGLMHKKWTLRVELTKTKTSHCKSRDFLRKRRLKTRDGYYSYQFEQTVIRQESKQISSVQVGLSLSSK